MGVIYSFYDCMEKQRVTDSSMAIKTVTMRRGLKGYRFPLELNSVKYNVGYSAVKSTDLISTNTNKQEW